MVASRMVRPGALFRVVVNMLQVRQPITVRASIQRNGVEMSADSQDVKEGIPETLLMRVSFFCGIIHIKYIFCFV